MITIPALIYYLKENSKANSKKIQLSPTLTALTFVIIITNCPKQLTIFFGSIKFSTDITYSKSKAYIRLSIKYKCNNGKSLHLRSLRIWIAGPKQYVLYICRNWQCKRHAFCSSFWNIICWLTEWYGKESQSYWVEPSLHKAEMVKWTPASTVL